MGGHCPGADEGRNKARRRTTRRADRAGKDAR